MKKTVPNSILLGEASDLLSRGIEVILMTKGNSMRPFINGEEDSVKLKKLDSVRVGDVVLARLSGDRYVLHRVIAADGDNLTLMGDGNLKGIEKCRVSDIAGTAISIIGPSGRERKIPDGSIWYKLLPIRRYLLFANRILRMLKLV